VSWSLANVEDRAKADPETFRIPSWESRATLQPGSIAKLVFEKGVYSETGFRGERMWVEVTAVLSPGQYEGKLANSPIAIVELARGDLLKFGAEHVADWEGSRP
jgi:hypothetical protein